MQTPGMLILSNLAPGTIERLVSYAQMAEARGLRNFLVTESLTDSLAFAQHLASKTARIQVGTGITNIYLRHPLLTALHALAIDQVAPGRLLLGLGTSHVPTNKAYGIAMTSRSRRCVNMSRPCRACFAVNTRRWRRWRLGD